MQGGPWARRMLSTQLASWAELRHDTVLYAKQSYTNAALCAYPDAYVSPIRRSSPRSRRSPDRGAALVSGLDFSDRTAPKQRIVDYFHKARRTATQAPRDRRARAAQEPIDSPHLDFINHAVSMDGRHAGCTMIWEPGGWAADLYATGAPSPRTSPIAGDPPSRPTRLAIPSGGCATSGPALPASSR